MSSLPAPKPWTEKQTKEVIRKVIRRAEVSRIARLLQHRLALANFKTKNGWENLTLDTIEPKVEEDLRRKRQRGSQEKSPSPGTSFFSEGDLEWLRKNKTNVQQKRRGSQSSGIGPLPNFRNSRKRVRTSSSAEFQQPSSKRRQSWKDQGRTVQSSPGYRYGAGEGKDGLEHGFHSSPPRTPPRRIAKPGNANKPAGDRGADLLIYLATSPSPAGVMPKAKFTPTTPPSNSSALPSSVMGTPGAPQTPQTGFNFADFVNITPSPAQGAWGSVGAGRGTPIANARKRLNFDQLHPPTGSPSVSAGNSRHTAGLGMELGGELVS
ncbi:hypothetical protein HOY80DRAFT_595586 [Tuber brumale]|nr:hypothetical protein HOY80DRAFT_595586 [Tuber brumale]